MRVRLYREGVDTSDRRRLEHTTWPEGHRPARLDTGELIGTVSELRREADGWVTGNLIVRVDPTGYACQAEFVSNGQFTYLRDTTIITGAKFQAVVLGHRPVWDGMTIGGDDET